MIDLKVREQKGSNKSKREEKDIIGTENITCCGTKILHSHCD